MTNRKFSSRAEIPAGILAGGSTFTGLVLGQQGLVTKVKAGVPVDSDWATAPPDGTLVLNSNTGKLTFRSGGTWQAVPTATEVAAKSAVGHTHAVTEVANLPWASPEMICNSGALADGYNDTGGGVLVEPGPYGNGCLLDAVVVRLGGSTANALVGGTGNLTIAVYLGSATAMETTLATTVLLGATANNVVAALATPLVCAANSVLRPKFTLGTATVAVPVHVQFRGRYA